MKKTILTAIAAISLLVVLVSGCVTETPPPTEPVCGDGACHSPETETSCPEDCLEPPMPEGAGSGQETPPILPF
jgi:hypothetical protein